MLLEVLLTNVQWKTSQRQKCSRLMEKDITRSYDSKSQHGNYLRYRRASSASLLVDNKPQTNKILPIREE